MAGQLTTMTKLVRNHAHWGAYALRLLRSTGVKWCQHCS
jgi:hypothetical protein